MEQSKRNVWLGAIALVLLGYAGYRVFFGSTGAYDVPPEYLVHAVCLSCGEECTVVVQRDDEGAPYTCQACGENAVYLWWYCHECKYRFVPRLVNRPGEPPRPEPFPTCTHCNCQSVSDYDPEHQDIEGTAKLPKWP